MPDPHTESGSQDIIIIPAQESMVSLHDVGDFGVEGAVPTRANRTSFESPTVRVYAMEKSVTEISPLHLVL